MNIIGKMVKDAKNNKDLKTMEALYKGNQYNAVIKFEYAKMLIYYGHYKAARDLLLELLNTSNADYAMLELGRAEKLIGNTDKALEYFEQLANKGDIAAVFELAKLKAALKKFDEARELFLSIRNNDSENYSLIELGKLEASQGNIELAKKYFNDAINIQKQPAGRIALGRLERSIGNIDEARKQFKINIKAYNDYTGKFELGKLELAEGNVEEARRIFEELYNVDKILSAQIELGKLEIAIGNLDKAEEYFLSLIGTRLERFGFFNLLIVSIKRNDYEQAFNYMKQALDRGNWVDFTLAIEVSKKLNIFFAVDYESVIFNYTINQLVDYDPYMAIEHIIERHVDQQISDFNSSIDVHKLFNEVKPLLTEERKVQVFGYTDIYLIPYNNIGANGENFLKVITLPNTKDVVTMFPDKRKINLDDDSSYNINVSRSLTLK